MLRRALLCLSLSVFGVCGCGDPATRPLAVDASAITVGVACRVPNWIGCDRVGIGVWLWQPAAAVVAGIAGRWATLSRPRGARGGLWQGYLYGVGPHRGPLRPHLAAGVEFWSGVPAVVFSLRLVALFPDGSTHALTTRVYLHPGFG